MLLLLLLLLMMILFVLLVSMCVNADISRNGQKFQEVTSFKYLGATLCKAGTCSAEIGNSIAPAMTAMARLNRIWKSNTISFARKFTLYKSLVTCIPLYCCETWTLLADSEKRTQVFKTKCLGEVFRISYLEHKTNDWVQSNCSRLIGHGNIFWQLSRDGNFHGSGKSRATKASPKPSFRVP